VKRPARFVKRSARVISVVLVALATVIGVTGEPAGASQLTDSGWWWKLHAGNTVEGPGPAPNVGLPQTSPAPPTPPTVPDGGLLVSRDPDGANAFGALRFSLGGEESNPVLTLKVAGDTSASEGDLLACQTGSAWTGEAGGRWDSKPLVECDVARGGGSVAGIPSADGAVWTFNLATLVIDGPGGREIDVAIVPALDAAAPAGAQTPFQVTFDKVDASLLETELGGATVTPPSPDSFSGSLDTESATSPAISDFTAPASFEPSIAQPALPAEDQGLSATAPVRRNLTTPQLPKPTSGSSEDTDARAAATAVLLLGAVVLYFSARQRTPVPQSLTRMSRRKPAKDATPSQPQVGGLGRFTRPRSSPPQAL